MSKNRFTNHPLLSLFSGTQKLIVLIIFNVLFPLTARSLSCYPISPLSCDQIQVSLPYNLLLMIL